MGREDRLGTHMLKIARAVACFIVSHCMAGLQYLSIAARCVGSIDFDRVDVHSISSLGSSTSSSSAVVIIVASAAHVLRSKDLKVRLARGFEWWRLNY